MQNTLDANGCVFGFKEDDIRFYRATSQPGRQMVQRIARTRLPREHFKSVKQAVDHSIRRLWVMLSDVTPNLIQVGFGSRPQYEATQGTLFRWPVGLARAT